MTRKHKSLELQLEPEVQDAVLEIAVTLDDGTITTVRSLVEQAQSALLRANRAVESNSLANMTLNFLMKKRKKRGDPTLQIHIDGSVSMIVSYDEGPPSVIARPETLPSINELRDEAESLGIDVSNYGRQKKKILSLIRTERARRGEDQASA